MAPGPYLWLWVNMVSLEVLNVNVGHVTTYQSVLVKHQSELVSESLNLFMSFCIRTVYFRYCRHLPKKTPQPYLITLRTHFKSIINQKEAPYQDFRYRPDICSVGDGGVRGRWKFPVGNDNSSVLYVVRYSYLSLCICCEVFISEI